LHNIHEFLADRTQVRSLLCNRLASVCRLSVCGVMYCR